MSAGLWGALQHFHPSSVALFPSISTFFPALYPHFLSSFCSATLSLLSLPLSLSCTNVLSHHCFSSLLAPSNAHTPSLEFALLPLHSFTFGGRPFSLVHSLFLLQSLMLISIARLPLFVVDFLIDTKSFTPSSSVSSKWNKMYAHWQWGIKQADLLSVAPISLHLQNAAGYKCTAYHTISYLLCQFFFSNVQGDHFKLKLFS